MFLLQVTSAPSIAAAQAEQAQAVAAIATTPSPGTPAVNKVLQFCAQVADQMGQVMPPSQ